MLSHLVIFLCISVVMLVVPTNSYQSVSSIFYLQHADGYGCPGIVICSVTDDDSNKPTFASNKSLIVL